MSVSEGCLCTCGHRTPQHEFHGDGRTPCAECECLGFIHDDNDPFCEFKTSPVNKVGRVDMTDLRARIVQTLEPLLGPKKEKL